MKQTISIVLFFILSLGLNAQTVEGTVGSDGSLIPYNVSGGLDETAVDAKIETANALNISSLTSDRTIAKTDFGGIIKHTTTGTKRINIPTESVGVFEDDGVVSILANGGGKTIINHSNGVTIDRLQLEGKGKMGTIARNGSDNWLYWGSFEPYVNDNPEVYVFLNSLSKSNNTDSTTGLTEYQSTISSVLDGGIYVTQVESLNGSNIDRLLEGIPTTYGLVYEYEFEARSIEGAAISKHIRFSTVLENINITLSDAWTKYTGTFTADGTQMTFNAYTNRLSSGAVSGSIGDKLQVKNLSIKLVE
ncbi:tail fiber protein [Cellulophaga phage phi19:3]|uniref:Structural protein n=1 Tax=Cellulophaga phage phi19:3 TaxID=1327971 RepID=R9ZZW0_9CAUD|nr:tail fiber protein [Cellulophaga phage phi19:3]AGO47498.1 structural protein [Cellulophaga phage phi19:3]